MTESQGPLREADGAGALSGDKVRLRAAVLGAGPGGMAIASDLVAHGFSVGIAELPEFASRVGAIRAAGGVTVLSPWLGRALVPVEVLNSVPEAVERANLVVVSVPAFAHQRFLDELLPHVEEGAALLLMGEGGGSLLAWSMLREAARPDVICGETNCLPFIAKSSAPALVTVDRKKGGALLAAIPSTRTPDLLGLVSDVWPSLEPVESVLETALINYDAIDTVPTVVANAGTIEGRAGGMLLWGEGATRSVVRVIEAVDGELLSIREALNFSDRRRYRDLLVAQGLAPDAATLFDVIRAGGIVRSARPTGRPLELTTRLTLDVGWSLAFASSLGRAVGVRTPVIDGLVAIASAMVGRDLSSEGRTLRSLGLDGLDGPSLRRYTETGAWPR